VKGLYLSANGAASRKLLGDAVALADRTEINAFVVDVKDDVGALAFEVDDPKLRPYVMKKPLLGKLELRLDGLYSTPILELPYFHEQYYGFDSVSSFSQNHAHSDAN
jgi:hypothetical protein